MSDFNYQQWRSASAVTPEMLDACLDRIAALEAELERATGERDRYEKQRDRAEQKHGALLVQLPYVFEVFDAEDGMPGLRMVSYKDRAEAAERERDIWHTRFSILQTAASGAGDRECQHDSISGNVCDGCGAYIKTVRLDDIGLVADILDYGQAEAELERVREDNDRLRQDRYDALSVYSTDGLLSSEWVARTGKAERKLTQAEADLAAMTKERALRNDLLHASNEELRRDLAAAREALRRAFDDNEWEVGDFTHGLRSLRHDDEGFAEFLARYQPAEEQKP